MSSGTKSKLRSSKTKISKSSKNKSSKYSKKSKKLDTDTKNIFSLSNSSKLESGLGKLDDSSKQRKVNLIKLIKKQKHIRKITPKQYCANYKTNILGKANKSLYESCKINQYCRTNKCNRIDQRFDTAKRNKLGMNANSLLFTSINKTCPLTMSDKSRKRCYSNATRKFYEDNGLGDIYKEVLECDKKTCSKERHIFYTNLFRTNKTKKKINIPKLVSMDELADKEIIENN
jgi:hypothetical protein